MSLPNDSGSEVKPEKTDFELPYYILASTIFLMLFSFTRAMWTLVRHTLEFYGDYGFYSVMREASLFNFLLYSILPFIFNAIFCLYFGALFIRSRMRMIDSDKSVQARSAMVRYVNIGSLGCMFWWFLFNIPNFKVVLHIFQSGQLEHRWVAFFLIFLPVWPTGNLPDPIPHEFLLFLPMGNLGIIFGFTLGIIYAGYLRPRQR